MKKFLSFLTLVIISTTVLAQNTWKADTLHSKITFGVTHLGIADVNGLFKSFDVTVKAAKPDFSDATFNLVVKTASINTEVGMRDDHLRSPDFFDVQKFPTLTFNSSSIRKVAGNNYKLTGVLTLHGVSKPVTMDLWYRGTTVNPMSKAITAGFQLTGSIKRSDFGIGPNFPPPMLSDVVTIKADGEFVKQ